MTCTENVVLCYFMKAVVNFFLKKHFFNSGDCNCFNTTKFPIGLCHNVTTSYLFVKFYTLLHIEKILALMSTIFV